DVLDALPHLRADEPAAVPERREREVRAREQLLRDEPPPPTAQPPVGDPVLRGLDRLDGGRADPARAVGRAQPEREAEGRRGALEVGASLDEHRRGLVDAGPRPQRGRGVLVLADADRLRRRQEDPRADPVAVLRHEPHLDVGLRVDELDPFGLDQRVQEVEVAGVGAGRSLVGGVEVRPFQVEAAHVCADHVVRLAGLAQRADEVDARGPSGPGDEDALHAATAASTRASRAISWRIRSTTCRQPIAVSSVTRGGVPVRTHPRNAAISATSGSSIGTNTRSTTLSWRYARPSPTSTLRFVHLLAAIVRWR